MGLNFSFLIYSRTGAVDLTRPADPGAAEAVVRRLFPRTAYRLVAAQPLIACCFPPRDTLAVGVFDDGVLIATRDAHLYDPQILNPRYLKLTEWPDLRLITSRSVNDMFAYGRWNGGVLARSISVNAVAGIWSDSGRPDGFEGAEPLAAEHWLDLANAALAFSLNLEGDAAPALRRAVSWEATELPVFERATSSNS
ncbi:hypothetical protein [Agreia sp. COWG]|uniref:DUF6928 family protein n=1 Tax=Agreia sp. COWG TaxID=2773266 RepID=UPI001928691F|nr:hypothetical protein [Agreia sp. COWG]CAD5990331.1 conserved protein of unknown function [Agreia sp. COWG]